MKVFSGPYRPWFIIGDNNGQVPLSRQFAGLQTIDFAGKSVLEIGCAEGLVSLEIVKRGARLVHGIEYRERAVEVARSMAGVLGLNDRMKFHRGDVRNMEAAFVGSELLAAYDIVLAMAVLQKVPDQQRAMAYLLGKCDATFVLRMPARKLHRYRFFRTAWSWGDVDPVDVAGRHGFALMRESCGYPQGNPPFGLRGEAWMAVFNRESRPSA